MQVTVHTAKTQLSKLIEAAERGEDVIIARGSVPVARIVPIGPKPFRFGILDGMVGPVPDFEPISDEDLDRWEREKEERIARGAP